MLDDQFRNLATWFGRVDTNRELDAACAWAGQLCRDAGRAGVLPLALDYPWPDDPHSPPAVNSTIWVMGWQFLVPTFDLSPVGSTPDNVHEMRWKPRQNGVDVGETDPRDWRSRAAKYAIVADHLAELAANRPAAGGDMAHSDDFRFLHWFGEDYEFTPNQAAAVKILYEHWERGAPVIGQDTILEAIDCSSDRLSNVFRDSKGTMHDGWNKIIVNGKTKGTYRLAPPDDQ